MDTLNLRNAPGGSAQLSTVLRWLQGTRSWSPETLSQGRTPSGRTQLGSQLCARPVAGLAGGSPHPMPPAPRMQPLPHIGWSLMGVTPAGTLMPRGWQTARSLQGLPPGCRRPVPTAPALTSPAVCPHPQPLGGVLCAPHVG